ncbi:roadblock/LC7 domain-containing protein [Streptomyces tsukubensis]|uniref:roadblock/LC7 domain-containing protein n=1 Tax=Streptomyces tsukubensis TaxID=83656 RepID=UPI0034504072
MAAEENVLDELRRLRLRMPQLTGALAAGTNGLVLGADAGNPEGVAALTAAALGVCVRLTEAGGQGRFQELLVRGERGYVASYAAGSSAVLTLLAGPRVNIDRLHWEARRSGARIGDLLDGRTRRARPGP